ncbi:hypothetical protein PUNSTDRAFT_140847 [Punctularia strigosozonata HHB-11173 SS5]|uniref:uncharacterized protein n=1 Tax=Punctularia strigosozonata (strain HHB-11173) TaxID=741275 RepID=UPI00044186D3|nr:uncharacterized protein PUNSTDRAFT_140847 [Punctularia strigosozonata HHB-11173 SS5]EIN14604.1 hypothetical protein PUNSTDRAFT_140847 [Punctularia strigosozonata HHB-11173 SS5]
MSDTDTPSAPRRSQRERKQAQPFNAPTSSLESAGKRKRDDADVDTDEDGEESDGGDAAAEEEAEYDAPKKQPKATPKAKKKRVAAEGEAAAPTPKKSRTTRAPGTTKTAVPKGARRGRKAQTRADDAFDPEAVAKESKINPDNHLFNAIMNPSSALQSKVEDFLESLAQTPGPAQAELISCILRACGCNDVVDEHMAVDYDGVVDALDNMTEAIKQDDTIPYPLTSKLAIFKRFRRSLSEFLSRLIVSAHDLDSLYTTDIMSTLQTWVVAMSSSPVRSVRHTATVVALEMESALCEVAARVEKEAEIVARQREGERKRKGKEKSKETNKDLEARADEIRQRRDALAEYLKEIIDGVFVHRYRDLDPLIRSECVRSLGRWFSLHPSHFLDSSYLRYIGWVLSDSSTPVRLSALHALSEAYKQEEYISSMHHFTERFSPRLLEMARRDTETGVRVAAVEILEAIDGHGLLDEEKRERLCVLVYDREPRVRRVVSGFVQGVWSEKVEERLVGRKADEAEKKMAGVKALAELLVEWGRALDREGKETEEDTSSALDQDVDADESSQGQSAVQGTGWTKKKAIARLLSSEQRGRTALAVEALYDEIEVVSDWEALLDILLLDHSAVGNGEAAPRGKARSKKGTGKGSQEKGPEKVVDEAWRLEEVEESVVLEALVAALRKAKAESSSTTKKGEEDTVSANITRALIKGLPLLFVKNQTDEKRIAQVLLIPQLMDLDMYLEMRMMTAYSSLWDDVTKQFTSQSSPTVLKHAAGTIRHLTNATSLANANSTKVLELEDDLASALRNAVAGKEDLEVASLEGDEVLSLGAMCARISILAGVRDIVGWMEEDEGGKQSKPWDIVCALAERGRLGYKEEEAMVSSALEVLSFHVMWKSRRLTTADEPTPEDVTFKEALETQRNMLVEKLLEYAVGTQSNTAELVKRTAFTWLLNIHNLFHPAGPDATGLRLALGSMALPMEDEVQYRCAGYIQAEIERYAEDIEGDGDSDEEESDKSDDEEETPRKASKSKRRKTIASTRDAERSDRDRLEEEYVFLEVISIVLRSITLRVMHVRHGALILAHYGRLGPVFDQCSKTIIDVLKEEGMYRENGAVVVEVVTRAMEESFKLVLDGLEKTVDHCVALAKVLATCFLVRGAQLSVLRKLDASFIVEIHTTLLSWLGKRLGAYESSKNKRLLETTISLFRPLASLVIGVDSQDALNIKAHLDQIIAQAKLEISPTAKAWEAARAYEKRLSTAMSKEKGALGNARKGRRKNAKSAEEVITDEEGLGNAAEPEEVLAVREKSRPKPRPRRAARLANASTTSNADAVEEEEVGETPEEEQTPTRKRPSTRKPRTPAKRVNTPPVSGSLSNGHLQSSTRARKRGRSPEEEARESAEPEALSLPSSPASQATQLNEVVIKRKRARH